VVAVSLIALLGYAVTNQWLTPGQLLISEIRVTGVGHRVSVAEVMQQVEPYVEGGILHLKPEQISEQIAHLGWVKSVDVKRVSPSSLELEIEEFQPALRWGIEANKNQWIDRYGELFKADEQADMTGLPRINGPLEQRSVVTNKYLELNAKTKKLALKIESLTLDARNAWVVAFSSGLIVDLGRSDTVNRWHRFELAYQSLKRAQQQPATAVASMDLRYPHGLAITWRTDPSNKVKHSGES
jgi:cell division protein FtsQ